jgi:hypothetical protein
MVMLKTGLARAGDGEVRLLSGKERNGNGVCLCECRDVMHGRGGDLKGRE